MHAIIVALRADRCNLKIGRFLKVVFSFVVKGHKELEVDDGYSTAVAKSKTPEVS